MKLVIDIPEDFYYQCKETDGKTITYLSSGMVDRAIKSGTPLPKGHGDLVDFDKLCEEYWDGNYLEIHRDDLVNIEPIIKADKKSVIKKISDIHREITDKSFTTNDGTEVIDCLVVMDIIGKYIGERNKDEVNN